MDALAGSMNKRFANVERMITDLSEKVDERFAHLSAVVVKIDECLDELKDRPLYMTGRPK